MGIVTLTVTVARCSSVFALAMAAVSCGGGFEDALAISSPPNPQSMVPLRSSAQSAATLAQSNVVMDWAERTFPQFFPTHQQNGTVDVFTYRGYPDTGNFIGVDDTYVYVKGPSFGGGLVKVGHLALLACTLAPETCTSISKGVFIGNSFTYSVANPDIGWHHSAGMAASSIDSDYVHVVAATLGLSSVWATNFAALEIDLNTSLIPERTSTVDAATAVTIALGDNASPDRLPAFADAYRLLLEAVGKGRSLVCVSTWWAHPSKDALIQSACEAHAGAYVYIGDIRLDPANRDRLDGPQYEDGSLQSHPHDWSMARIASRVASAHRR